MQEKVAQEFIDQIRFGEREAVIAQLMNHYNESCCCDEAAFGDHYLSHKQPDNFIDMIRNMPYEY
jgi:hypothetical protein